MEKKVKNNPKLFKEWLLANDYSIAQFAREIGISREYLSKIIHGKVKPSKFLRHFIELKIQNKLEP